MNSLKKAMMSFCLAVFSVFVTESFASEKVIFATSGDYAPANMSDDLCKNAKGVQLKTNNNHTVCGFEIDVMTKVCEVVQWSCEWTSEPFAWNEKNPQFPGILEHLFLSQPRYDLVIAYLRGNKERLEKLSASASYIEGHPTMYKSAMLPISDVVKNKKGFPISKKNGQKIKIGASGSYVSEIVSADFAYYSAKQLANIEVVSIDSLEDQIHQLSTGQIDFVYGPNISASQFIAKMHFSFLEVPQLENSIEAGSRVFGPKNPRGLLLIDQLNQGLLQLWNSGEYQKIFDKYHIYDSWGKQNGPK